jgi:esterase/lipase superfamily enzyme
MRHYTADLWSPAGARGSVAAYGHYGRPVLVFPTEGGNAGEFADHGMVAAVGDLVDAGRVKLYCVDSFDTGTWSAADLALEERALRHGTYQSWILDAVVPHVRDDSGRTPPDR